MDNKDIELTKDTLIGWRDVLAGSFEKYGVTEPSDTTYEYNSPTMKLIIETHTSKNYLRAHILNIENAGHIFIIEYDDNEQLVSILKVFVEFQDTDYMHEYQNMLKKLVKVSKKISIETENRVLKPLIL